MQKAGHELQERGTRCRDGCLERGRITLSERWSDVGHPQKPSPPSTTIFFLPPSAIILSTPAIFVVELLGPLKRLWRATTPTGITACLALVASPWREEIEVEARGVKEGARNASAMPTQERRARAAAALVGTNILPFL